MRLIESIKNKFLKQPRIKYVNDAPSSSIISASEENDGYVRGFDAYIHDISNDSPFLTNRSNINSNSIELEANKIDQYRNISSHPEVSMYIDEIINEMMFSEDNNILKIKINIDNKQLVEKIEETFDKIIRLAKLDKLLYNILRQMYVDGQLVIFLSYKKLVDQLNENDDKDKSGKLTISKIDIIEPKYLVWDEENNGYRYINKTSSSFSKESKYELNDQIFDREEIVKVDFGIRGADGINLGYLDKAIKTANQLKTLEDLLIPMRFSRSVSRRVFNVDVSNLPPKRATEVLQSMQEKLRYKKSYNTTTGEVKNEQHIISLVEDYWFSNRDGSRGVQVETIDETGNLGEMGDILYFNKKLYRAMNIPAARASLEDTGSYDFDGNSIDQDELKFQTFISRIRKTFTFAIKEVLKRELVASGVMSNQEWREFGDDVEVFFPSENSLIEKIKTQNFRNKLDLMKEAMEMGGKYFSVKHLYKKVWGLSDGEIDDMIEQMEAEKNDPKYKIFYEGNSW